MKITIDTKEDSHEEIRKIIGMLHSLVSNAAFEQPAQSSDSEPITGEGIFGMFNNESNHESAAESVPSEAEVAGMFSENREEDVKLPEPNVVEGVKKDDDDDPQIVPY